ncbi:MAG TPA: hypothetical protein VGJ04_08180 [Pirellulales bacterium]
MDNWCCNFMKNCVAARHDRGFFVYAGTVSKGYEQPWFFLCYRAVDEHQIIASITPAVGCLSLAAKAVIHFCPGCGVKLADFYRLDYQKFMDPTLEGFPSDPATLH